MTPLNFDGNDFHTFFREAPVPFQVLDPEGKILAVNPAWRTFLGYPPEEVIGCRLDQFLPDNVKGEAFDRFTRPAPDNQRFQQVFVDQSGNKKRCLVQRGKMNREDGSGEVSCWVLFPFEEQASTAAEPTDSWDELFQALIDHLPAAVSVKDAEENIQYVNEKFAEIIHSTPGELIGRNSAEITPPRFLSSTRKKISGCWPAKCSARKVLFRARRVKLIG